jgi:putative membrane protein
MPHRNLPWWYFFKPFPDASGTFSYAQWARHQSVWRFAAQPKSLALVVFNQLPLLAWVACVSVATTAYYELYQTRGEGRLVLVSKDYIQPFLLTSLYMSLLLVHRVSSSFERWWSARKHWGQMYNDVRSLARLNMNWIYPTNRLVADKIHRYLAALGAAAASFLLKDNGEIFFELTAQIINHREAMLIQETEQPPITLVMLISQHITMLKTSGTLDSFHAIAMEDRLTRWVEEFGAHERILSTPTYTAFTRQTSRFLILWLTFLPFALSAFTSWACCGIMPVLCFLLAGIDNIASACENPMTSLPCRALAAGQANTVEVVRRTKENTLLTQFNQI